MTKIMAPYKISMSILKSHFKVFFVNKSLVDPRDCFSQEASSKPNQTTIPNNTRLKFQGTNFVAIKFHRKFLVGALSKNCQTAYTMTHLTTFKPKHILCGAKFGDFCNIEILRVAVFDQFFPFS